VGIHLAICKKVLAWQSGQTEETTIPMLSSDYRIARMQKTLRWFENDIPLLNTRVKELSPERQQSAQQFAAAVVDQTRAELQRLLEQQPADPPAHDENAEVPCEPAD
jgi:hypothetical protein